MKHKPSKNQLRKILKETLEHFKTERIWRELHSKKFNIRRKTKLKGEKSKTIEEYLNKIINLDIDTILIQIKNKHVSKI